jgi:hypothetical protein
MVETEGLDPEEKTRLFNLLNTMGNQAGGEALKKIDWEAICSINNIPTLTQEQVDELYERELERTKERNEALAATAGPQGTPPGGEKPEGPKKSVTQEGGIKNSVEWMQYQLESGAMVPAIISRDIAEQIEDYGAARPFVISMQVAEEDNLERIAQQILDELLADESESISEAEAQEVLEAIIAYLEGRTELELDGHTVSLEYDGAIELGVGDFLKKAWGKIKSVANKVVKAVTGRGFSEWKERRARIKRGKEIQKEIRTKDGRVWREEDHPRDSAGKFARKGSDGKGSGQERSLPPGAAVAPKKDFSKETVDEAISRMNVEESLSSSQMATLRLAVEKAKADPYLGTLIDFGKFQVLGKEDVRHFGYYEPRKDKVFLSISALEEKFTDDDWKYDEKLKGFSTKEEAINAVFAEAVLHEGAHSVLRNGKKLSAKTVSISLEESCTELIAWRALGDMQWDTHPRAYSTSIDLAMHLFYKAHGPSKDDIWDAVYAYHQNGATSDDMLELVYRAYDIDLRSSRTAAKKSKEYVPFGFLHQGFFEFLEYANIPGSRQKWVDDGEIRTNWLFGG